jgi:hypothetical protein
MSGPVEFVEKPAGIARVWKQSLKSARFQGWVVASYWCRVHGMLERFRIPVLSDRGKRRKKCERPFAWIFYVRRGQFKVYSRCTVNLGALDVGPKEIVDAMYRDLRGQTSLDGSLRVSFQDKEERTLYCVQRDEDGD